MSYFALANLQVVLLGLLSGVVGTVIVLRRRSFFAVALSHATFPGGVVFALVGWNLLIGQALFALLLVLIMTLLARIPGQGSQVASGVVLSFGFALGTLLTSLNPGLGIPVESLLVGSPLGVTVADVNATVAVFIACLLVLALFGRRLLFHTFDPVGYRAAGYRVWPVELIVSGVVAAAVVVAMPAVGAILGVAVLIAPAAAARFIAPTVWAIPPIAAGLGIGSGILGLWISREFDVAAGGSIGLTTTGVFLIVFVLSRLFSRGKRSHSHTVSSGADTGAGAEADAAAARTFDTSHGEAQHRAVGSAE